MLVLLHLGGTAAGFALWQLGVPLAWLIGATLFSATITVAFDTPAPPRFLRFCGQLVVGGAIGLYLTPEAVDRIIAFGGPILASAILITLIGGLIGLAQAKLTDTHRATAIFSAIPGGPVEMANLAEQHGGDPGRAAFAQTLRILLIILLYPPLLMAGGAAMDLETTGIAEADVWSLVLLLSLSAAGAAAAYAVRLANPFFLGPMVVTGLMVGGAGVAIALPPDTVIFGAQVLLGVSLGAMLRRDLVRSGLRFLAGTAVTTAVLLGSCLLLGLLWAGTMEADPATMVLATAPGAVTEMAITAKAMGLDVSLVAAFQVVRIFLSMAMLPFLFSVLSRL